MSIQLINQNLFESADDGLILTIDGAAPGMEGNLARNYARLNPDVWEELEFEIDYPINLGRAKIFRIPEDLVDKNKFCILASTLNHIETLSDVSKIQVQSSAFREALSLAERYGLRSLASAVMVGGWRLAFPLALESMIKTYADAKANAIRLPVLKIYIFSRSEFEQAVMLVNSMNESELDIKIIDNNS